MSNSLQPHGLQGLPCPSSSPRACSDSCPLSWWCHPTISSSVVPFSSWLQSFPASGSVLMSRLFTSGGRSIGASASASVLPMNIQDWYPLWLAGLISLQSKFYHVNAKIRFHLQVPLLILVLLVLPPHLQLLPPLKAWTPQSHPWELESASFKVLLIFCPLSMKHGYSSWHLKWRILSRGFFFFLIDFPQIYQRSHYLCQL